MRLVLKLAMTIGGAIMMIVGLIDIFKAFLNRGDTVPSFSRFTLLAGLVFMLIGVFLW